MVRAWLGVALAFALAGCGFNDGVRRAGEAARLTRAVDHFDVTRSSHLALSRQAAFYVAWPQPSPGQEVSAEVARRVAQGLATEFPRVFVAQKAESLDEQLAQARSVGAAYLISPALTEWKGDERDDKGKLPRYKSSELRLVIRAGTDGEVFDVAQIRAHNGYISWMGDSPGSILVRPLRELAAMMAGGEPR